MERSQTTCFECGNPFGQPWHNDKNGRCYYGDGPLWLRLWRRIRS